MFSLIGLRLGLGGEVLKLLNWADIPSLTGMHTYDLHELARSPKPEPTQSLRIITGGITSGFHSC